MRILHLSSEHPPQQIFGLGRYVCDLARELARQQHEIHILTNSIGGKDRDVVDHGVNIHRIDFPPPPMPPGSVAPVAVFNLYIQQRAAALGFRGLGAPEAVVSHDWLTAIAASHLAKRFDIPHVWTVHDTAHGKRLGKVRNPAEAEIIEIERWAARTADFVLVNSESVREEIITAYEGRPERTAVLPCAVDPENFVSAQPRTRIAAFRQVFAGNDDILITFTGRLDVEKGIDILVNAFQAVHRKNPNCKLAIVGHGSLAGTITDHINKLNLGSAAKLYGYLAGEALKHFYLVSDIHVCPSTYEPFGIVALEAMAAGAAVVASATGGLKDIFSKDSIGRQFQAGNTEDLASILLQLAQDSALRAKLGKNALEHVKSHFTWPIVARRALEFYRAALASNGKRG